MVGTLERMADQPRTAALVFGEVAEDYDRVRLGYPPALVDDILGYSGLGNGDLGYSAAETTDPVTRTPETRALEIGAGTGKATVAVAVHGLQITAVEPDGAMADVLARHIAGSTNVRIVRSTFEAYEPDPAGFDLLYCADAWHWTRPDTRWLLAARALRPGGTLALFSNNERIIDAASREAMLDVLTTTVPSITVVDDIRTEDTLWTRWPGDELALQPDFGDRAGHIYSSSRTISGRDYLAHMFTRSQCRMLEPPTRQRLFAALNEVFPDEVAWAIETELHLARRR